MATPTNACPQPPYPGLINGSPGYNFALAMTILFPLFAFTCLAIFAATRRNSVFLRKRSFKLTLLSVIGTATVWASSPLYDTIGSGQFNCALFNFLVYATNPAISFPLVLKISNYNNQVSYFRLGREFDKARSSVQGTMGVSLMGKDPLAGELSLRTFAAHLRTAFCFSRSREDRILHAKFARTSGLGIVWFFLTSLPFFVVYFIRLGTNPHWLGCTGCELESVDAIILIVIAAIALLLSSLANPSFSTRVSRRDALRIVRECMWSWMAGGIFYILSFAFYIGDPGDLYAQGLFNWRIIIIFATYAVTYIQTIHQILVSRRLQRAVLFAPTLDQGERFNEVMAKKELRSKLQSFLDNELSGEILKFLQAIDEYRQIYGQEGSQEFAKGICSSFITRGAPLEVNVSSGVRDKLVQLLPAGPFSANVFDEAYHEVRRNFLADGFARFLSKLEKQDVATKGQAIVTSMSSQQHASSTVDSSAL